MVSSFPPSGYQPTEGADGLSRRAWKIGFWRRAPISGLLALVTAILCGVATIAVLRASDGLPINHWRVAGYSVQPTVLLSIFATLANALFRYAFTEGARISWWVEAQQGTSIGALHRSWDHAQSALPLATAGRDVTFNAVASFFLVMLLIDGPLFQRASSVGVVTRHNTTQLIVPLSPSPFMAGATGIYADHDWGDDPSLLAPEYSKVLQHYNNRQPITLPEFGCKGKCDLELTAPGWDVECDSWKSPYRLMGTWDFLQRMSNRTSYNGPAFEQIMFWSNITYDYAASNMYYELLSYRNGALPPGVSYIGGNYVPEAFPFNTILLSSMRKATPSGNGTLDWRYCVLREAVQTYPVTVTNTTVTIPRRDLDQNLTVYKVIREGETSSQGLWPSTVGGLWHSLWEAFSGKAWINSDGPWNSVRTNKSSALVYIDVANATMLSSLDVQWNDPIDDMISMIQELSLRTAIVTTSSAPQILGTYDPEFTPPKAEQERQALELLTAAQPYILSPNLASVNRTLQQRVNTSMHYEETVYQSHYDWMLGALAAIVVAFCSIIPTFKSWWHLGRTVSMSPIETAKAFDAPILRKADPNGTAHDVTMQMRSMRVQYGAALPLHDEDGDSSIEQSKGSSSFHILDSGGEPFRRNRLHFGREGTVTRPLYGQTFDVMRPESLDEYARSSYHHSMYSSST